MTRRTPKPHRDPKQFVRFLLIAIILMVFVDFFIFREGRPYFYDEMSNIPEAPVVSAEPILVQPPEGEYFEAEPEELAEAEKQSEGDFIDYIFDLDTQTQLPEDEIALMPEAPDVSAKQDTMVKIPPVLENSQPTVGRGKIAIVIDDMGMNLTQSRAAIDLPSNVTLAFLPYAEQANKLSAKAKEEGHEVILHAPMEAMDSDVPLGGMALTSDMDYARFTQEFETMLSVYNGFDGVNNHMGSKLTQDKEYMAYLMDNLKQRDMYFLDSRTIHTSVALDMAKTYGVPAIERDVFLDHEETAEYTANALSRVEKIAKETGSAIAIGHPKEITMEALRNWIPTLESKGLELVKVSEIIKDEQKSSDVTKSVSRETLGIAE